MKAFYSTLKFAPCVFATALLVVWPVSWFYALVLWQRSGRGTSVFESNITYRFQWPLDAPHHFQFARLTSRFDSTAIFGYLYFVEATDHYLMVFPIPLVLTSLFPLIVGPFIRYRFRLWHYFAWIAIIAIELACYLRRTGTA